jgi:methylglyoxal synthase
LCATHTTGAYISDVTGLEIETLLAGSAGTEQISSRISYNEVDLVFFFRGTDPAKEVSEAESNLLRLCDVYNVPVATNIATAEALVQALDNGSLDWRNLLNPHSEYNINKKRQL